MSNDTAYANGAFIPGAADYPARWAARALAFRARMAAEGRGEMDMSYGPGARQSFDLFRPDIVARGLMVFVHGGYWRAFDCKTWSHLATGALARGWAVALPSYTLAPSAGIPEITREIAQALTAAARRVAGDIVLCGHSAGGHLVARMLCRDVALPPEIEARLVNCVPISPVSDLRPLIDTVMNLELRLDMATASAESPCLHSAIRDVPMTAWVGADERPAFLDQARWLAEAWPGAALHVEPGQHHFDVIAPLEDPDSPLMHRLLG